MDYFLSEEQLMVLDLCRQIAEERIKPVRAELDEKEEFPHAIMKALAQADPLNRRVVEQMLVGVATRQYARSLEPVPSDVVSFGVVAPQAEGRYGAKGLGEIVLAAFAPAVGNAVYNATGRRIMELPLKRETVWRALQAAKTGPEIAGGVK